MDSTIPLLYPPQLFKYENSIVPGNPHHTLNRTWARILIFVKKRHVTFLYFVKKLIKTFGDFVEILYPVDTDG